MDEHGRPGRLQLGDLHPSAQSQLNECVTVRSPLASAPSVCKWWEVRRDIPGHRCGWHATFRTWVAGFSTTDEQTRSVAGDYGPIAVVHRHHSVRAATGGVASGPDRICNCAVAKQQVDAVRLCYANGRAPASGIAPVAWMPVVSRDGDWLTGD